MNVIFLGNIGSPLIEIIESFGDEVIICSSVIKCDFIKEINPDFVVSYGYPFIVKQDVLNMLPNKIINLHCSYLPWNRGSDPDLWSLVDGTPKGVTIHFMDAGVDTGDIIAQTEVECRADDLLGTYYDRLHNSVRELFKENWIAIKEGDCERTPQQGEGTCHRSVERERIAHLLKMGEKTPVDSIISAF